VENAPLESIIVQFVTLALALSKETFKQHYSLAFAYTYATRCVEYQQIPIHSRNSFLSPSFVLSPLLLLFYHRIRRERGVRKRNERECFHKLAEREVHRGESRLRESVSKRRMEQASTYPPLLCLFFSGFNIISCIHIVAFSRYYSSAVTKEREKAIQ
jgi:hypothetical protein